MTALPRTTIVIPAYNRRAVTISCLEHLRAIGDLASATAIIVDDGSTDGTGAAVAAQFPAVIVLRGDGQLWWTGAIVLGMKEAVARGAEVILWLNDDCRPRPGVIAALARQAASSGEIAAAETLGLGGGRYTGYRKSWRGLVPAVATGATLTECDTMNGNCVAIPRPVIERIGYPDARRLPHVFGDTDYGLTARQAGFRVVLPHDARCDDHFIPNASAESWLFGERTFWQHLETMRSPKSYFYFPAYWVFCTRHWGLWGVALFLKPYLWLMVCKTLRALVPRALLVRLAGPRSLEYRKQQELAAASRSMP